jgi:hypothetical protein
LRAPDKRLLSPRARKTTAVRYTSQMTSMSRRLGRRFPFSTRVCQVIRFEQTNIGTLGAWATGPQRAGSGLPDSNRTRTGRGSACVAWLKPSLCRRLYQSGARAFTRHLVNTVIEVSLSRHAGDVVLPLKLSPIDAVWADSRETRRPSQPGKHIRRKISPRSIAPVAKPCQNPLRWSPWG